MSFDLKFTLGALPVMERGMGIHLSGDPKNTSFVYCCGSTVFIRELANTKNCWTFNDNQHPVTVAKYAPSGFYIAAGDEKGMVKIFDTTTAAHPVKIELPISSGKLRDIAWTEDSKRVCVVGSSTSGNYGRVFLWDSGSSVGEISGSSDSLLTCDIRPTRPYRMITAGEDSQAIWFEGPPFKFKRTLDGGHTRFVTAARFSPSGEFVVVVSQDKKGSVFDGTTGDKIASLEGGHKGGIYALSWSPDSKQFVTASADKSLVVWAAGTWKPVATLTGIDSGGMDLDDQQLAVLWLGPRIISAGLNGFFHVFDPASPAKPLKTIHGHNKIITAMATDANKFAYTAGFDGLVVRWDLASGDTAIIRGVGHSNQINRMALSATSGLLYSGAMDDSIRVCPVDKMDWQHAASIGCNGPVRDVAVVGDLAAGVTSKTLYLLKGKELKGKVDLGYDGVSVAISPDGKHVVVGGGDTHVHVYAVDASGSGAKEVAKLEKHRGPVGSLAFSPNGAFLASADTEKRLIVLWCAKEWKSLFGRWEFHTGNVRTLAWAPDSVHLASGAIDESVIVWTALPEDKRLKKVTIPRANRGGVNSVAWLDGNTIATVGADCTLRAWGVTFL